MPLALNLTLSKIHFRGTTPCSIYTAAAIPCRELRVFNDQCHVHTSQFFGIPRVDPAITGFAGSYLTKGGPFCSFRTSLSPQSLNQS